MDLWVLCIGLFSLGCANALLPDSARFSNKPEDLVVPRNVTPECLAHATHWMSQLRRGVPWALQMLDSATKLPSGVLFGASNHMGNFDQCVAVSVKDEVANFQGRFCRAWMDIQGSEEIIATQSMTYAFCVPSSCIPEEVPELLQSYVGPALGLNIVIGGVNPLDCYIKELPAPLPTSALICTIVAGLLTTMVIISAVVEWRLADKTPPLVRACSLTNTCRSLFNTRKHPADISCLHGLRVGSMLWIILGHRYGQERWMPLSNPNIFPAYFAGPLKMTVLNALLGVDVFFFLSGLLICISFLRELQRRASFDVIKFYIYRYLRLAIPIGVIIAVYIAILPILGQGPIWNNYTYYEARNCRANWWITMLFVNNYIGHEGFWPCLGQTWYTAVDMQLSWLSPLVLLPLYHSPRAGLQLMTLLILISCFIPFTVTYIFRFTMNELQIGIDRPLEGVPEGNMRLQIYSATQARATPYLCGILFGFYLFKTRGQKINISKIWVYTGWTFCTLVALTVIYSLTIPYQPGYVYDLVGSAFYGGFHRLGWSVVLIWIVFACVNGYGGLVDKILSWNMLLPISRLTYSAFLVHIIAMIYEGGITRTLSSYSDFDAVHDFFGDLVPVLFLSLILYILVESPLLSLLRVAFSKGKPPSNKK